MAIARLDTNGYWMVGSSHIYIPAPNTKIEHTNVASADSGRTEDGVMHINWVRRDVRKVNLIYNAISGDEKDYMMNLMQGKEFTFYHRVISDVESYRQKLYGSIPLAPFSNALQEGDTLRFVINTYDEGITLREFVM